MRLTASGKAVVFLALIALVLIPDWAFARQETGAAVVGQVTNLTPGAGLPPDLPVTLHVFAGPEEVRTQTVTASADGTFRFDDVARDEGKVFVVRCVHRDVVYSSDPGTFEPDQAELALPVAIYETTEAADGVLIAQLHLFIAGAEGRLQVTEYFLVGNSGDRTFVGVEEPGTGRRTTISFRLPDGALGLRFDGAGLGERYFERGGGLVDTLPVPPGTATVEGLLSYELPQQKDLWVERTFDAPIASVVLMLEEGMSLRGEGLESAGIVDTQMGPAPSYTAGPLAAGEPLAFTLDIQSGTAAPSEPVNPAPGRGTTREISGGLVALAAAVVVTYLLWRPPVLGALPAGARSLVAAIAALDSDFEMGRVARKVYRRKRRGLKRQLRALLSERSDD